jgi:hypothetical protein
MGVVFRIICDSDPETMTEKRVEIYMLERLEREQKSLAERVDNVAKSLRDLNDEVNGLRASIPPRVETPGWIKHVVYPLCVLVAASMVGTLITLLVKVNGLETFVHDNGGFIAGLRLQQNATDPGSPQRIADVRHILGTAKQRNIRIPADLVESAGRKFVQVSQTTPDAWTAVLDFLNYQSFLNLSSVPMGQLRTPEKSGHTQYSAKNVLNFPRETVYWMGYSEFPEVAQFREIGAPDLNAGKPGPAFLLFDGADVLLDNMHIKRVIFRNSHIIYKGGPVDLETVYFVNCTFEIVREPNGLRLAEEVLSSPATTAKIG